MAYQTYITEALVCGSKASNTSDRSYLLFTKDAGMLWATARSVREEKSKQRYALQDFSIIRVSLVRGKATWRIGSVEASYNAFMVASERSERADVVSVVRLLRQYIHGEEPVTAVYEDAVAVLGQLHSLSAAARKQLVTLFQFRLVYLLGYVGSPQQFTAWLPPVAIESIATPIPAAAEVAITNASQVSHL